MSDNNNEKKNLEIFKWFGWGSPVGLGIFIVCCALVVFLLALAGSLFI
ncbi:MAG: hypothetical protein LBQ37_00015 [Elusimicrobiota bacterium]|nr:hypothetical protein [Elusimicrobiota bacterium]